MKFNLWLKMLILVTIICLIFQSLVFAQVTPNVNDRYQAYAYPNPFNAYKNDPVKLSFVVNNSGIYDLYIFNLHGEIVYHYQGIASQKGRQTEIIWDGLNIFGNYLPSGVYLIKIWQDNQVTSFGKISLIN